MDDYSMWSVKAEDLSDLNPQKARDLMIKCFFEAQKETFKKAKQKFGKKADDEEIMNRVKSVVKLSFEQINADFENPGKSDLLKVVERLAQMSGSWGTPPEIIEHHKKQIQIVLEKLT